MASTPRAVLSPDQATALDALLSAEPDWRAWRALTEALDDWPTESLEAAVARAEVALESWPVRLRGGERWLTTAAEGSDEPRARLVRVTYIAREDDPDDIAVAAASPRGSSNTASRTSEKHTRPPRITQVSPARSR